MKETLERLWNEYFSEECAVIETEEERLLSRRVSESREVANATLTAEQCATVQQFIDALYEMQSAFVKKAFFKGCEFALSFIVEAGGLGRA